MRTTTIAECALEWWRAGGPKDIPRLLELVEFFAQSNNDMEMVAYHKQSALCALRSWELER
jgi:hypothetical protein